MCVIAVKKRGVALPNGDTLRACFDANPDGTGYMVARGGQVHIRKGFMTLDDLLADLKTFNVSKRDALVLHFRIATHGGISKATTHPFPVAASYKTMRLLNQSVDLAIAHNGVLDLDSGSDKASDSMALAKALHNNPSMLNGDGKLLELAISGSRVVSLDGSGTLRLFGRGWSKEKCVSYSNSHWVRWLPKKTVATPKKYRTVTPIRIAVQKLNTHVRKNVEKRAEAIREKWDREGKPDGAQLDADTLEWFRRNEYWQ